MALRASELVSLQVGDVYDGEKAKSCVTLVQLSLMKNVLSILIWISELGVWDEILRSLLNFMQLQNQITLLFFG